MIATFGIVSQECIVSHVASTIERVDPDIFPDQSLNICQPSNRRCYEDSRLGRDEMSQVSLVFWDAE